MKPQQLLILFSLLVGALDAKVPPNVVLIMSDDMGFSDIGCYGGEIETPHLDALAANGLRFTQFYNTARCCPTRASLLSGVYQHQAGIGLMTGDRKLPGYRGEIGRNVLTIAEALRTVGYRNYMSGKWHVTRHTRPQGPKDNWPLQRGFDRFYGTIIGAGSFYDPATLCRGNTFITPVNDKAYQPETYYYTHAINDNAVAYLQEHAEKTPDKPFFLYVAHTAAHWPMHALPKDIAKYKGRYDDGFAPIREARLKRLKEMGIVGRDLKMSPRSDDWDKTPHKDWERRNMEVYAAMVDSMDQGIGRIIEQVKKQGQFDNTLFSIFKTTVDVQKGMDVMRPRNPTPNTSLWGQISSRPRYGHPCRRVMAEPFAMDLGSWQVPRTLSLGTAEDGPMSLTLLFASISTSLTRAVLLRLWWHTGPRGFPRSAVVN